MEDKKTFVYEGSYEECPNPKNLNGLVKVEYKNGDKFEGFFKNGEPHMGEMICNCNGDVYEYKFENGKRSNKCTVKYNNGDVFGGKIDEHGNPFDGKMTYTNGYVFRGYFKDKKPLEGFMTYNHNGDVCEYEFKNGNRSNECIVRYSNGNVFGGKIDEPGNPFDGKMTYTNGYVFRGYFKDKKPFEGLMTYGYNGNFYGYKFENGIIPSNEYMIWYSNGYVFRGKLDKDGKPFDGEMTYPNDNVFKDYFKDKKPLEGSITRERNGNVYEYKFENGKCSNECTVKCRNDNVFKGKLDKHDNFFDGEMTFPNGDVFGGYFKDSKPFEGSMTCKRNSDVCEYKIENGKLSNECTVKCSNGNVLKGEVYRRSESLEGSITCKRNGNVYEYKIDNGRPSNECTIRYNNGNVFRGKLDEHGNPFDGEMTYPNGDRYEGKFKDGKPSEAKVTYSNGDFFDGKFENGKIYYGNMWYKNRNFYEGYFDENGKASKKGKMWYYRKNGLPDGVFEGEFKDGKCFYGTRKYFHDKVFEGEWKDDKLCKGTKTHPNGDVYIGEWENDSPLDVSNKLMLSDTRKLYCLYRDGRNNFQRDVKYCLDNHNEVTINYEKINEILNKASSKINSLDDLIEKGVIEGVGNFNELKEFAKEVLQGKMLRQFEAGFISGGYVPLGDLLLLSSVDRVEQLKKTRFQLHYMREDEDSLKKDYGSLKNLLESFGIDNINEVKEDYTSLKVDTIPPKHAVSVILDIKKMKDLMKETGKEDLDEAVASEKVIHCFDSSRAVGCHVMVDGLETYFDMGALTKNCDFVNLTQQNFGSCWFHALASTLTALRYPELIERIRDEEIELYDIKHRTLKNNDKLNEFQLRQMNTVREISKKFDIGLTEDGREVIDLIIDNQTQEEVGKMPFPDVLRELGIKTENKAEEIGDKKGQSDFSYRVRVINGRNRAIEKLSKKTESNEKVILKELETQRGFLTQNGKRRGVDDNAVHYGRNKPGTFVDELKKRRNSISGIRYKPDF